MREKGNRKDVGRRILVLFDTEEEYATLMTEYLKKQRSLPWVLHTYTNVADLLREEKNGVDMLVVAESAYEQTLLGVAAKRVVVLNESGLMQWEDTLYVDKYQEAGDVLKYLLGIFVEIADVQLPRLAKQCKTVFVGNYSPVRRSMQTSFALTMSQMLAQEHPTLYLNFEHYAGVAEILADVQTMDLADLLYFLNAEQDKFRLRLGTMLKRKGNLDYIPPMKSGQNLLTVTGGEWMALLRKLEELGEYEYIVLDLSESMQGLFEILRMCTKVYTTVREDRISKGKIAQYEQVLALYEYEDVLEKTKQLNLSHIKRLPEELEQLTKGDLAKMVRGLIKELKSGDGREEAGWNTQS